MTPTWESPCGTVKLYLGDCLDVLPHVRADCVVTDPSYAIPAAHYVGKRGEATPRRNLAELSIVEHWFRSVCEYLPDGAAYVFCDGQSYPIFFRSCYNRWKHVRPIVWDKMVSYNGYTWRHQHELIAWCESAGCDRIPTGDGDIIRCRAVPVDVRSHPAEKPVELIEKLLAKTKGVVLDPFMGSGPTIEAAIRLGRNAVGIELDERYFWDLCVPRAQRALAERAEQLPFPPTAPTGKGKDVTP